MLSVHVHRSGLLKTEPSLGECIGDFALIEITTAENGIQVVRNLFITVRTDEPQKRETSQYFKRSLTCTKFVRL
jgi:hypothetical protein